MTRSVAAIKSIAHHRNGVTGEPFHVVLFHTDQGDRLMATVFAEPGHCAVIDPFEAHLGEIGFGRNSWRGDVYEYELRDAIDRHDRAREQEHAASRSGAHTPHAVLFVITGGRA